MTQLADSHTPHTPPAKPAPAPAPAPPARRNPHPPGARRVRFEPFDVEAGPITHLASDRRRLRELTWRSFSVEPLGATIGAEIGGVDLNEVDDEQEAELWHALLAYKVIFFRDQDLTPAAHVALARRFGDLEVHPFIKANPEHPELVRFEKDAEISGFENGWHSDVSWRERPSMGAILRAVKVPPVGGDTLFADMYAAYDGLDDKTKDRIASMTAVHDYSQVFGHTVSLNKRAEMRRQFPPVRHPVVRHHPDTGRPLLYVNRFFVDHLEEVEPDEGHALIDRLARQAEVPEYQCRFRWRDGSVAFWDNRAVQHYAASDYWPEVRIMERASIVGDRPS
jgi:taurine dioxygenase